MQSRQDKRARSAHRRRRRRQFIGLLVFILSVVGAATLVTFAVRGISSLVVEDESEQDFRSLIAPLVSMDPTPFDRIEDAGEDVLLESAVWAAISYEDTSRYSRSSDGHMLVPAVDVDRYISRMYGHAVSVTHHTFSSRDLTFTYDDSVKSYAVPITGMGGAYFPRIDGEETSGNTKILTVAYTQYNGTAAEIIMGTDSQKVAKYMEYVLVREGGDYHIYAVRTSDAAPDSASAAP